MRRLFLVATLVLAVCAPVSQDAPGEAGRADEPGDCRSGEPYTCEEVRKASGPLSERTYDYQSTVGYREMVEKVGKTAAQLEAEFGDVERGLIELGCEDQAPGPFPAVLRPGDTERDQWCSGRAGRRFDRVRAGKRD